MFSDHDCPACTEEGSVSAEDDYSETCACLECGATFEIDPDADCDEDGYFDCSTVGKQLTGERPLDTPDGIWRCMDAATDPVDWARRMGLVLDHLGLCRTLQMPLLDAWNKATADSPAPWVDAVMLRLKEVAS